MSPGGDTEKPGVESYSHDPDGAFTREYMARRTATNSAGFLLPHLRAGQRLLDVGSGQGTITIGLADAVSPGEAIGVDIEESQVTAARERANERGVSNIRFELGSAYELDFDDESFDVIYSNATLEHLSRPLDVLKRAWRLLKPGGIVAVRSGDFGGIVIAPENPLLEEHWDLYRRYRRQAGGDPLLGRKLRSLLFKAGFKNTQYSSSCSGMASTTESDKAGADGFLKEWTGPKFRETAIRLGWADNAYFDRVAQAYREWIEEPGCFSALIRGEAIGWKI